MRFSKVPAIALPLLLPFLPVYLPGLSSPTAIAQPAPVPVPAPAPIDRPTQPDPQALPIQFMFTAGWMYTYGATESSLLLAERGLEMLEERGDRTQVAERLTEFGNTIRQQGQLQQALPYYQRALVIYGGSLIPSVEQNEQLSQASKTATTIAEIYQALGQYEPALAFHEQAQGFHRRANLEQLSTDNLIQIGNIHQLAGRPEQALAAYQQAQALLERTGDRLYETQLMNRLGLLYQSQGQFDLALTAYQRGLAALEDRDFTATTRVEHVMTLDNMQELYQAQGQTDQATLYGQQVRDLLQNDLPYSGAPPDEHLQASVLNEIGQFYLQAGQRDRAKSYFDRAVATSRASSSRSASVGTYVILGEIGLIYQRLGLHEQALPYQQQMVEVDRTLSMPGSGSISLRFVANTYQALGQWESALAVSQERLSNLQAEIQNNRDQQAIAVLQNRMALDLLQIGKLYQAQGQTDQAIAIYEQILGMRSLDTTGKAAQAEALRQMGKLAEAQGQIQQAQQYYQQSDELMNQVASTPSL